MRLSRSRTSADGLVDLTPMIDVMFLLLVFFTLTSQFSSTQRTPMDLPRESGESDAERVSAQLVVDLDRDGVVRVLGQVYDLPTLAVLLAGREFVVEGAGPEDGPSQPVDVVIRADRRCSTASLNALAEVLIRAGVRRWSLATSAPGGAPEGEP